MTEGNMLTTLCTLLLLLLCDSAHGWWGRRPSVPPTSTNSQVGQTCTPRYSRRCGSETILSELAGPADGFGPNVCKMEQMVRIQMYSYEFRQHCYNRYWGGRRCYVTCSSTGRCDATRDVKRTKYRCCDGFTVQMLHDSLRQQGCPIMLENSVVDCLQRLNMTMLLDDEDLIGVRNMLSNSSIVSTVFVPSTTDALNNKSVNIVTSHVAKGSFRAERLFHRQRLTTAANGRFIHITSAKMSGSTNRRLFVNGVEVTRTDACFARNGIVHIIDGVIMSSSQTILQVLNSTPQISKFSELVRKANLNNYLNNSHLLSVFAPVNEAIDSHIMSCLCRPENRYTLSSFIKYHIVSGAEYESTLRLRTRLYPVHCGWHSWHWYRYSWKRCSIAVSIEGGDIVVSGSRKLGNDISARNGIIHTISRPLTNPNLNLAAKCPPPTLQPTTIISTPTSSTPPSEHPSTTSSNTPTSAPPPSERHSTISSSGTLSTLSTVSETPSATRPPDEINTTTTTQPPTRPPDEITNRTTTQPPTRPPDEA